MKNFLDRYPLMATFALMVVSGVIVAVVAGNMSDVWRNGSCRSCRFALADEHVHRGRDCCARLYGGGVW